MEEELEDWEGSEATQGAVAPDWLLQVLVAMVDRAQMPIPVTLTVAGCLVSGQLASARQYHEGFLNRLTGEILVSLPRRERERIREDLEAQIKAWEYGEEEEEEEEEESEEVPEPTFIHLQNAGFLTTAGAPVTGGEGVWWRGRLSQVDGFVLGVIEAKGE